MKSIHFTPQKTIEILLLTLIIALAIANMAAGAGVISLG